MPSDDIEQCVVLLAEEESSSKSATQISRPSGAYFCFVLVNSGARNKMSQRVPRLTKRTDTHSPKETSHRRSSQPGDHTDSQDHENQGLRSDS